jgi:hypothetical protein
MIKKYFDKKVRLVCLFQQLPFYPFGVIEINKLIQTQKTFFIRRIKMENLSFGLGLFLGSVVILPIIIFTIFYRVLAPRRILVTFGHEERAMYKVQNKKFTGEIILPSHTKSVNKNNVLVEFNPQLQKRSFLGLYWVGFFKQIYTRRQQWHEWKSIKTGREIAFHDEMTPFLIVVPFEYAMLLEGGEDKNGLPLNVTFTVILEPVHATLPVFGNENAYSQIQTLCIGEVLLYVREKTFSNLGAENTSVQDLKNELSIILCGLNKTIRNRPDGRGIIEVLGYRINDAKLDSVEIVGDDRKNLLTASTAKYIAEENANALRATADGEKDAEKLRAEGKKAHLDVQAAYLHTISEIPGAMKVEERKATPGLTTLVEADNSGKKTSLLIGGK